MFSGYVENYLMIRPIVFHIVETGVPILNKGGWNGRGVEISVECDAGEQVAAVAEPLSAVAAGNLFGPEGRHGAGS